MKVILATGIFPPEIGGPATYVRGVARELKARGEEVVVITYGAKPGLDQSEGYWVISVGRQGGLLGRWFRYRRALVTHSVQADYICAFTSVSAGVPLIMSGLQKPKKILRLGGDFFWERYTDGGGTLSLREWYASRFGCWRILSAVVMGKILRTFDNLVYSTEFQRHIHVSTYRSLPVSSVESNARPEAVFSSHEPRTPFRLLFMGRFVRFKNIPALIDAVALLPAIRLTIIGAGPMEQELRNRVKKSGMESQIYFRASVSGDQKRQAFDDHDLLVLPSFTEISPNTALEARAAGLPVLLTEETGLPDIPNVYKRRLRRPTEIAAEISEIIQHYPAPKPEESIQTYRKISDALFPQRSL